MIKLKENKSAPSISWALDKANQLGYERGVVQTKREELLRAVDLLAKAGIMSEVEAYNLLKAKD